MLRDICVGMGLPVLYFAGIWGFGLMSTGALLIYTVAFVVGVLWIGGKM